MAEHESEEEAMSQWAGDIEKRLGKLCCYHDSLMPVLGISDYGIAFARWETTLKSLHKKLTDYEAHIENNSAHIGTNCTAVCFEQGPEQLPDQDIQLEQQKQIDTIKFQLGQIQLQIQRNEEKIHSNQEGLMYRPQTTCGDADYTSVEQHREHVISALASFQNQAESFRLREQQHFKKSQSEEAYQQQLYQKLWSLKSQLRYCSSQQSNEEQTITQRIQSLRQFHSFSFNRVAAEILESNDTLESLFQLITKGVQPQWRDKIEYLKLEFKLLDWQIRGLNKKYLRDLTDLYDDIRVQMHDPQQMYSLLYQVHLLEKAMSKDTADLSKNYNNVLVKLNVLLRDSMQLQVQSSYINKNNRESTLPNYPTTETSLFHNPYQTQQTNLTIQQGNKALQTPRTIQQTREKTTKTNQGSRKKKIQLLSHKYKQQ